MTGEDMVQNEEKLTPARGHGTSADYSPIEMSQDLQLKVSANMKWLFTFIQRETDIRRASGERVRMQRSRAC